MHLIKAAKGWHRGGVERLEAIAGIKEEEEDVRERGSDLQLASLCVSLALPHKLLLFFFFVQPATCDASN